MITEDYCSYEVAKLLKEKGFDEPCYMWYDTKGDVCANFINPDIPLDYSSREYYLCPSQSVAMKWLREVHGIFIAINNDDLDFNWQCYDLINRGSTLDPKILSESYAGYKTYEEAVDAALKYCLQNLI